MNSATQRGQSNRPEDQFYNPYNFVPALPRPAVDSEAGSDAKELNDHEPIGHDRYASEYWSGKITVQLKTVTPLLIPDAAKATENEGHKTYPLRCDTAGNPYLPPTSVKGMLRTAYEAVTNSRLSVFVKHEDRLAYRMNAKGDDRIFPARVECNSSGELSLRILQTRDSIMGKAGRLPRYRLQRNRIAEDKGASQMALPYKDSSEIPHHGDPVWVRLNPANRYEQELPSEILENLKSNLRPPKNGEARLLENVVTRIQLRDLNDLHPPGSGDWYRGWVCITGANISGKLYERVFLESEDDRWIPITEKSIQRWKELICNYQETHQKKIEQRRQDGKRPEHYLGNEPGKTAWSSHVYTPGAAELQVGTLCYVEFGRPNPQFTEAEITAILPVQLSRRLYEVSPAELLHHSLWPANELVQLSPADRVFGWVRQSRKQQGASAYRGQLRVGSVKCRTPKEQAIQRFGPPGLPLAILGQPKPQQFRFYTSKDNEGKPVNRAVSKEQGYSQAAQSQSTAAQSEAKPDVMRLRGRKVYPHHANLATDHWNNPTQSSLVNADGSFREYCRPDQVRDTQNRSMLGWVNPATVFEFEMDVINLSSVELGALLWLLTLPENRLHRLGGGKPLGFGSVQLSILWDKTDLRTGAEWCKAYSSLTQHWQRQLSETIPPELQACIARYQAAVAQVYQKSFETVRFITAFCHCAEGMSPIHYPRIRQRGQQGRVPPNPQGEGFDWFVENERGEQMSLPDLVNQRPLRILPQPDDRNNRNRQH